METVTTFRQYVTAQRNAVRAEYGITVAEAEELYGDSLYRSEWLDSLTAHAFKGGDIPASVARTLSDAETYHIAKFGYSGLRFPGKGI